MAIGDHGQLAPCYNDPMMLPDDPNGGQKAICDTYGYGADVYERMTKFYKSILAFTEDACESNVITTLRVR